MPGFFGFGFKERRFDLWSFTAGIKRELVSLLAHAYRLCRQRGAREVAWSDVGLAYRSIEFSKSRNDVALLISHAAQGGTLRQDLLCPFADDANGESVEKYKIERRNARANKVVAAAVDASMTVTKWPHQPLMVEPRDPFQRGQLDGLLGLPWPTPMNDLSLVQAVDGLGQGVFIANLVLLNDCNGSVPPSSQAGPAINDWVVATSC